MSFDLRLQDLRLEVDKVDSSIYEHLVKRMQVITQIAELKKEHNVSEMSIPRQKEILANLERRALKDGIPSSAVTQVYKEIFTHSVLTQSFIIKKKQHEK